jgi:hypothetical protein
MPTVIRGLPPRVPPTRALRDAGAQFFAIVNDPNLMAVCCFVAVGLAMTFLATMPG